MGGYTAWSESTGQVPIQGGASNFVERERERIINMLSCQKEMENIDKYVVYHWPTGEYRKIRDIHKIQSVVEGVHWCWRCLTAADAGLEPWSPHTES